MTGQPIDLRAIQWHPFRETKRYASRAKAARACTWLNSNHHRDDDWLFRPGRTLADGRTILERRYVGRDAGTAWWSTTEGQHAT